MQDVASAICADIEQVKIEVKVIQDVASDSRIAIEHVKNKDKFLKNVASDSREAIEHVKNEVKVMFDEHSKIDHIEFNNDEQYKKYTAQAIDSKLPASKKLEFWIKSIPDKDEELLERIRERPFKDFAHDFTIQELKCPGLAGFPWKQLEEKSKSIEFGVWTPETLQSDAKAEVLRRLKANEKILTISIGTQGDKSKDLYLDSGWETKDVNCDNIPVSPALLALLLSCCSRLERLSLR